MDRARARARANAVLDSQSSGSKVTHLECLLSGMDLSNGMRSLRYWLNPFLSNPAFSSALSSSDLASKLCPHFLHGTQQVIHHTRYIHTHIQSCIQPTLFNVYYYEKYHKIPQTERTATKINNKNKKNKTEQGETIVLLF